MSTSGTGGYTPEQAAIRDCYDSFLDGLERFAHYAQSDLTGIPELRRYLGYWIDTIHEDPSNDDDAAWLATLITYIEVYNFEQVFWHFQQMNCDISPQTGLYEGSMKRMADQQLAAQLTAAANLSKRI